MTLCINAAIPPRPARAGTEQACYATVTDYPSFVAPSTAPVFGLGIDQLATDTENSPSYSSVGASAERTRVDDPDPMYAWNLASEATPSRRDLSYTLDTSVNRYSNSL